MHSPLVEQYEQAQSPCNPQSSKCWVHAPHCPLPLKSLQCCVSVKWAVLPVDVPQST